MFFQHRIRGTCADILPSVPQAFEGRVGREALEFTEKPFEPLTAEDLLAFPEGAPPQGAADLPQLFQRWKAAARLRVEETAGVLQPRQRRLHLAIELARHPTHPGR